ncbi:hypothetical protein D6764_02555 [Candidatus Woesearchaeota archaeon]|nr:MAG: hypothetical protein D6764_02555 [Candidatus Woesearchaeota archaeon]
MNPLLSILSGFLLGVPLIAFYAGGKRKSLDAHTLAEAIVISHFLMSSTILLTALLGIFNGWAVLILSSISAFYLGKKSRSKTKNLRKETRKFITIAATGFIVFTIVVQNISPVTVTLDGYQRYLPWAKIMAESHSIPGVIERGDGPVPEYITISSPHLLYGFLAVVFSAFGSYSDGLIAGVPLYFSLLALIFLLCWAEEEKKGSSAFIMPLLLGSYAYLLNFHSMLQEVPLFLYFSIGIFMIKKLSQDKSIRTASLLGAASALTTHTKYNGLIFSAIAFMSILFLVKKHRMKAAMSFMLFHIPTLIWLVRNYIIFNNPFYRQLFKYFPGKWNYARKLRPVGTKSSYIPPLRFVKNLIVEYPPIVLALAAVLAKRKDKSIIITALVIALNILFIPLIGARLLVRYIEPFFGVLSVLAASFIANGVEEIDKWLSKKNRRMRLSRFARKAAVLATILLFVGVPYAILNSPEVKAKANKVNSEKETARFILDDYGEGAVLWGELSPALEWYANAFIITPSYNMFLIANGKAPVPYNETHIREEMIEKLPDRGESLIIKNPRAEDYNMIAHQIGAEYVYDSAYGEGTGYEEVNALEMADIYKKAEENPELFTLVYQNQYGARLWRIN